MNEYKYQHEASEALEGRKPLAIIEERKAPRTFGALLELDSPRIILQQGDEGPEVLVGDIRAVNKYRETLRNRGQYRDRFYFQVAVGQVLGYDFLPAPDAPAAEYEAAANGAREWWFSIGLCGCSKCGGPITRTERLQYDAGLARTQPHAEPTTDNVKRWA